MNWKEQRENAYPNIILSDCLVDEIQVNDKDIILKFLKHGFVIRDDEDLHYYRTKSAQIIMKECDIENISIQLVNRKRGVNRREIQFITDIELQTFLNHILSKRWNYEIVEEYYSALGGFFIGQITESKKSMWCYLKIQFKNIVYLWDEVNYEAPFDCKD